MFCGKMNAKGKKKQHEEGFQAPPGNGKKTWGGKKKGGTG